MWIINVLLIFGSIIFMGWFISTYGNDLSKGFSVLISGLRDILFVLILILLKAVKAAIIGGVVGGICGVIFKVAGAPMNIITTSGVTVGVLIFAFMTLKALVEEWNNLRWSIRNAIRNRYRKR